MLLICDSGWTGAKLAQLLQEAALVAVRRGHRSIIQSDLDDAVDRLTVGPKRIGIDLGHQGQCRRATTEAGTALTSHLLRRCENAEVERCDRISINPRGQVIASLLKFVLILLFLCGKKISVCVQFIDYSVKRGSNHS